MGRTEAMRCRIWTSWNEYAWSIDFNRSEKPSVPSIKFGSRSGGTLKAEHNTCSNLLRNIHLLGLPAVINETVDVDRNENVASTFARFSNENLFDLVQNTRSHKRILRADQQDTIKVPNAFGHRPMEFVTWNGAFRKEEDFDTVCSQSFVKEAGEVFVGTAVADKDRLIRELFIHLLRS